jgi:hypothetical protein
MSVARDHMADTSKSANPSSSFGQLRIIQLQKEYIRIRGKKGGETIVPSDDQSNVGSDNKVGYTRTVGTIRRVYNHSRNRLGGQYAKSLED